VVNLEGDAEGQRLASLRRTGLLDTRPEAAYDAIVAMASAAVGAPIAMVSLIDEHRQWFKARVGFEKEETAREIAFCDHAIRNPSQVMVVNDAVADPRFAQNPSVTDDGIRFYAGFPLVDDAGLGLGTLCVVDHVPRHLTESEFAALRSLADIAQELIRLRTMANDLDDARRRAQLFERGFDVSGVGKLLIGRNGRVLRANRAFADMIGWEVDNLTGEHWRNVGQPDFSKTDFVLKEHVDTSGGTYRRGIGSFRRKDGEVIWSIVHVVPVAFEGSPDGTTFVQVTDISETIHAKRKAESAASALKESEQLLAAKSLLDPLTGAANRVALHERLEVAFSRLDESTSPGVALAMIDLDHFKAMNDTHGHEAGDAALLALVASLNNVVREGDLVARVGGDEFIVLFDGVDERHVIDVMAPRLVEQFEQLVVPLANGVVGLAGSVGVAWSPKRVARRDLIARADAAMFQAKRHGRNRLWVSDDQLAAAPFPSDSSFRQDLAAALALDQFVLHYQPVVNTSGQMTAVEALLRWNHPDHGTLLPQRFLGELIASGAIAFVGQWALSQACKDAALLASTRPDPLAVHVNMSPGELVNSRLGPLVRNLLADLALNPEQLVIEITEEALVGTIVVESAISELAATGVRLTLDDFGTGSSSLAHLRRRPLHGIKIDRSFVAGIGHDETDMAILSSTISLARQLGLDVVAEGVETTEQHEWLLTQGCTHFQGWLTGRPVPLHDLPA
jgi:diguanylate cyclase (GGDEF)-like protein/PAS domain S-box-containing protein